MTTRSTTTTTLSDWSADSSATLTVSGPSIDAALAGALQGILDTARATPVGAATGEPIDESITAPIRGQGESYGEVLLQLANDLLAQLDANGAGLSVVRLDGLLAADDGGFSAWGALAGAAGGGHAPQGLALVGTPTFAQDHDDATTVTLRLVRS